jgi:hypothetical protein
MAAQVGTFDRAMWHGGETCAELISWRGNRRWRAGICRSASLLFDEWV